VIFLTVGTQLSFDRLVSAMDGWCANNPSVKVVAQVGPSKLKIRHMECVEFIPPTQSNQLFLEANLIVAHAGMGSILTALKYRKPILIMPRKASLGEQRNDHQMATAKRLADRTGIIVAWNENDIPALLDSKTFLQAGEGIPDYASPELIGNLKNFISAKN